MCIISDNSDDLLIGNSVGYEGVNYLSEALAVNTAINGLHVDNGTHTDSHY